MFRRLDKSFIIVGVGLLLGASMGLIFTSLEGFGSKILSFLRPEVANSTPQLNHVAPDFELLTLDGQKVRLSSLQGSPVVINFWATWCFPCREEMPLLQQAHEKNPDLIILAVNADEPTAEVQRYIEEMGLTFPVLLDEQAAVEGQYRVTGLPTSYFVDRDGVIRSFQIGILAETQLDRHLATIGAGK